MTLAMSIGNVFFIIEMYGVRASQSSDCMFVFKSTDYVLARVLSVSLGLLTCCVYLLIASYPRHVSIAVMLYTGVKTFEAFSDVFYGELQRIDHLELAGYSLSVHGLVLIICFWVGLRMSKSLNFALLLALLVSAAVTVLVDFQLYRHYVPHEPIRIKQALLLLKNCFPLLCSTLFPVVITAYPRIILERFFGEEILGFFGNISSPATILTVIIPNIVVALMPTIGRLYQEKKTRAVFSVWIKLILSASVISMLFLIGTAVFGNNIFVLIYTDSITPYVKFFYQIILSTTVYAFAICGGYTLVAMNKKRAVGYLGFSSLFICLVMSNVLIQRYQITGAVVVQAISYGVQFVCQTLYLLILCREA